MKNTKEVSHTVPAPPFCLPASTWAHYSVLLQRYGRYNPVKLDPRSVYQADFTYIISFQLHSAAEYEGVEVGLLENFIEGSFVLQFKSICSEIPPLSNTSLCSNPDLVDF